MRLEQHAQGSRIYERDVGEVNDQMRVAVASSLVELLCKLGDRRYVELSVGSKDHRIRHVDLHTRSASLALGPCTTFGATPDVTAAARRPAPTSRGTGASSITRV